MHGHGDKPYLCTYDGCDRALPGNGFPRNWNLRDHMRRVHNDDGKSLNARSGPPSPPGGGHGAKDPSKSRKRRSDPAGKSPSSRKAPKSPKAVSIEAPVVKIDIMAKLREDYFAIQAGLPNMLSEFPIPDDPTVIAHINRAKDALDAMARTHMDMMAAQNGNQHQYLAFGQHSG